MQVKLIISVLASNMKDITYSMENSYFSYMFFGVQMEIELFFDLIQCESCYLYAMNGFIHTYMQISVNVT